MIGIRCYACDSYFVASADLLRCRTCDSTLLVVSAPRQVPEPNAQASSIWEFSAALPEVPISDQVSLGEGGTPLLAVDTTAVARAWVKWEGIGPTQSYKDRFNAVNMSVAKHLGVRGVALVSTGNAGLAAAAYGAAAGLEVMVICTPDTPSIIREQIPRLGAQLRVVDRLQTRQELRRVCSEGWFPGSRSVPATDATPFGCEGYKTISYEIVGALGDAPACVVVPVGGGDGIFGIGRGFSELFAAGHTSRMPRLIGARATSPRASSIVDDEIGVHAVDAVRSSDGCFIEVDGAAMDAAVAHLGAVGVSAEPASACAWAAVESLDIAPSDEVVTIVTGHGFKWGEKA